MKMKNIQYKSYKEDMKIRIVNRNDLNTKI